MKSVSKANILLVDDNSESLTALEAILSSLNQNLVKAHSGEEALRYLLNDNFAVILLDVHMPGMNGFETANLIRQRESLRDTPIIFLTAFNTSPNFVSQAYSLGAVDYLSKPLDPIILKSKVSVFVELFKTTQTVAQQAAELAAINTQLRQTEEQFRCLSDCVPTGIFLTNTDGYFKYTNPSCQTLFGINLEGYYEDILSQIVHQEDQTRVLAAWSTSVRCSKPYSDEFRIRTSTSDVRWVNIRTSPMLSDQKQLLGYVGSIEDVTETKLAQAVREQMIRSETARAEAEAANRMKDEFLAIVSHELRTPLTAIVGWSKQLLTRNFDEATKTRALQIIQRNANSQNQLIEDILDVSRIIRGKVQLSLKPVNLLEVIKIAVLTVRPLADVKNIQIQTSFDEAAKMVSGDAERVRQIICNLLTNAIKFTPQSGQVKLDLSLSNSAISGDEYSNTAQITITDTGIGISEEFLPHIFDRFSQADTSSSRSYGGLGLGLTIVRHLVELHQGKIYAHSEGKGKGSTFKVYLPILEVDKQIQTPTSSPQEAPQSLDGVQVLIVEDNDDNRDMIEVVLADSGASVTAVASASLAQKYLQDSKFDVLVSDIAMPEINGYELINYIRELQSEVKNIPAIALTACAKHEDQIQALTQGFQMHIPKPVDPTDLIKAVGQLTIKPKEIQVAS